MCVFARRAIDNGARQELVGRHFTFRLLYSLRQVKFVLRRFYTYSASLANYFASEPPDRREIIFLFSGHRLAGAFQNRTSALALIACAFFTNLLRDHLSEISEVTVQSQLLWKTLTKSFLSLLS